MNDTVPNPPDVTSPLRSQLRDLAALLALWRQRDETPAPSRAAAGNALAAIDGLLRAVDDLQSWLIDDVLAYDNAAEAAVDTLLERLRQERGRTPLPDDGVSSGNERPWVDGGSGPGWSPDPDDTEGDDAP